MLVLVLEFSRISAATLYQTANFRQFRSVAGWEAAIAASPRSKSRSSKTEDESPDLRSRHLSQSAEDTEVSTASCQWYVIHSRLTSIQLGSCLPIVGRCAP